MNCLDLISLTHNALGVSGTRWASINYQRIFQYDESGRAVNVVGTVIEIDDGHQWMKLIYRIDQETVADSTGVIVTPLDMSVLKRIVHIKQGMENCKGTLNAFLNVLLDRLIHHGLVASLVDTLPQQGIRRPTILRFSNEAGTLTIARMVSEDHAMASYNVKRQNEDAKRKSGFWEKLRLYWNRKS